MPLTPNQDQKKAIQHILKAQNKYQAFLLDGLTGSGKTEVYLQVMQTGFGFSARNWTDPPNH
jgi:primosomal protein N' (replication factor Y)